MKYRKKPVVIEAWDTSEGLDELRKEEGVIISWNDMAESHEIYDVLHDTCVKFDEGDYIIRGVKGEYYPCKPDVFEATYERVEG